MGWFWLPLLLKRTCLELSKTQELTLGLRVMRVPLLTTMAEALLVEKVLAMTLPTRVPLELPVMEMLAAGARMEMPLVARGRRTGSRRGGGFG